MIYTKLIRAGAASALSVAVLFGAGTLPVIHADAPAVSYSFWSSEKIKAPVQKPLWTTSVDVDAESAITDYSTVLSFSGKKLIALNLTTGQKVFTYGNNLKSSIKYLNGNAYGLGEDGHVYAINAKTGKELWKTGPSLAIALASTVSDDTVYVTTDKALIALDATTGKQCWSVADENAGYPGILFGVTDGVVFVTYDISGAYSYSQLTAIDQKTGKVLWKAAHQNVPFAIRDGLVYSERGQNPLDEVKVDVDALPNRTFNVLKARTGEKVGERVYSWPKTDDSPFSNRGTGSMLLDGNDLYLVTGNAILKYDFNHYAKDSKPLQKWVKPYYSGSLIGSVHAGRIYFIDYYTHSAVTGMKLANGQEVKWGTDNPPVQTDIYGNGVYIGQSDGVFHGYNLQTTAPAFTVNTGSRNYGSTLHSGNTLVIQAKDIGKLIAVPVPKALQ